MSLPNDLILRPLRQAQGRPELLPRDGKLKVNTELFCEALTKPNS